MDSKPKAESRVAVEARMAEITLAKFTSKNPALQKEGGGFFTLAQGKGDLSPFSFRAAEIDHAAAFANGSHRAGNAAKSEIENRIDLPAREVQKVKHHLPGRRAHQGQSFHAFGGVKWIRYIFPIKVYSRPIPLNIRAHGGVQDEERGIQIPHFLEELHVIMNVIKKPGGNYGVELPRLKLPRENGYRIPHDTNPLLVQLIQFDGFAKIIYMRGSRLQYRQAFGARMKGRPAESPETRSDFKHPLTPKLARALENDLVCADNLLGIGDSGKVRREFLANREDLFLAINRRRAQDVRRIASDGIW